MTDVRIMNKKGSYYQSMTLLHLYLLPFLSLNKEIIKTNVIPNTLKLNDSKCFKIKK